MRSPLDTSSSCSSSTSSSLLGTGDLDGDFFFSLDLGFVNTFFSGLASLLSLHDLMWISKDFGTKVLPQLGHGSKAYRIIKDPFTHDSDFKQSCHV